MSLASALAPIEAHNRNIVMAATFGHLAPKRGTTYPGSILFTQTEYGQLVPIRSKFEGLPDSPWFFEHLHDFVGEKATEAGQVYRFEGDYVTFKNGSHRFRGKITKVKC